MKNYYIIDKNGNQIGPLSTEEVKNSNITPETLIWCEGMLNWQPAKTIPEISALLPIPKQLNVVRTILLVYAISGSLVSLLVSKFAYAIIASWFNTHPYFPGIWVLAFSILTLLFFLLYKKRKYLMNVTLIGMPILMGSLFSVIYYNSVDAGRYYEGFCSVRKSSGYGVINKWGCESIPCIYRSLMIFDRNYPIIYKVFLNKKCGIIDQFGNEITSCEFDNILPWNSNYYKVIQGDKYGIIDHNGQEIIPCEFDKISKWRETSLLHVERDDQEGLYSEEGEVLIPCLFIFSKELRNGCTYINSDGYVDSEHHIKGGIWGMINKRGEIIVPCKYDDVTAYIDDGYIKATNGNVIIYYDFSGNYLRTEYKNNFWSY